MTGPGDDSGQISAALVQALKQATRIPERLIHESAWNELIPLSFFVLSLARPKTIVELGVHHGASYCSFCQAAAELSLDARCYGIDSWEGDPQTGYYDGDLVLQQLRDHHDPRYSAFSQLVRTSFDQALDLFAAGSIDLLHIDGMHSYDAVRRDFENWLPKLSPSGVVLFHDTAEHQDGFGVHLLWEQIKARYPVFEVAHGHGLGIAAVGREQTTGMAALTGLHTSEVVALQSVFASLGQRIAFLVAGDQHASNRHALEEMTAERERQAHALEEMAAERERQAHALEEMAAERERRALEFAAERERLKDRIARLNRDRDRLSAERKRLSAERERLALELKSSRDECLAASNRHHIAQKSFEEVTSSAAWRVTAPVRRAIDGLRGGVTAVSALLTEKRSPAHAAAGGACATLPKVLIVSGEPDTPGHIYRVENAVEALREVGYDATWVGLNALTDHAALVSAAEALVLWRVPWSPAVAALIEPRKALGVPVVYDVDDHMFDPGLATAETIDAIRSQGFAPEYIRECFALQRETLARADYATCPTTSLAAAMANVVKRVFVVPNGFNARTLGVSEESLALKAAATKRPEVVLGYAAGTKTHQRDFAVLAAALAQVMERCPEVRFCTYRGNLDLGEFPELEGYSERITLRDPVPPAQLPRELAEFDVNLAPLETENPFCEGKSELKYFEAGLVRVPTVASPTEPFRQAITDGVNGLLAAGSEEWRRQLETLVRDAPLRAMMGINAYFHSRKMFGPQRRARLCRELFAEILPSRAPAATGLPAGAPQAMRGADFPAVRVFPYDVLFESPSPERSDTCVVMPLFNYGHYLEESVFTVVDQSLAAIDLVIVDDASTDGSAELACSLLEQHRERFRYCAVVRHRKNSGLSASRNLGFSLARSPFILPLDPDNILLPECLEELRQALLADDGAAMAYPTIEIFGARSGLLGTEEWDPAKLCKSNYIDAMAMIRHEAWELVGGYTYELSIMGWEDYQLWCKFVEAGLRGTRVPTVLARYRTHSESMLMQITEISDNKRQLVEELRRLHPWLEVGGQPCSTAGEAGGCPPANT